MSDEEIDSIPQAEKDAIEEQFKDFVFSDDSSTISECGAGSTCCVTYPCPFHSRVMSLGFSSQEKMNVIKNTDWDKEELKEECLCKNAHSQDHIFVAGGGFVIFHCSECGQNVKRKHERIIEYA